MRSPLCLVSEWPLARLDRDEEEFDRLKQFGQSSWIVCM